MRAYRNIHAIVAKELYSYLASPVAYVFIVAFLVLTSFFTFSLGGFFERNEASLEVFFLWHPWLYWLLAPALGMRLWADERKSGTLELMFTMPVAIWQAIVGKFVAGCILIAVTLALTFPMVWTVIWLGNPDLGVIACGYLASFLCGAVFFAVATLMSSLTRHQVVAFIIALPTCLLLILAGWPPVTDMVSKGNLVPHLTNFTVSYLIVGGLTIGICLKIRPVVLRLERALTIWVSGLIIACVSFAMCLGAMMLGYKSAVSSFMGETPSWQVELITSFSIMPHYESLRIGIVDTRAMVYFLSIILLSLFATNVVLHSRR